MYSKSGHEGLPCCCPRMPRLGRQNGLAGVKSATCTKRTTFIQAQHAAFVRSRSYFNNFAMELVEDLRVLVWGKLCICVICDSSVGSSSGPPPFYSHSFGIVRTAPTTSVAIDRLSPSVMGVVRCLEAFGNGRIGSRLIVLVLSSS